MLRYAKLIYVSPTAVVNSNKYYEMQQVSGDSFMAKYGRVGGGEQTRTYSMRQWDSKYREKLKKDYKDVTEMQAVVERVVTFKDVSDGDVNRVISMLMDASRGSVGKNYSVSGDTVTTAQIDAAAKALSDLVVYMQGPSLDVGTFNRLLVEVFTSIPRRMTVVADHLLRGGIEDARKIIDREQSMLDALRGQAIIATKTRENVSEDKTILDILGVTMRKATDAEVKLIKSKMGADSNRFLSAYKVEAKDHQKRLEEQKSTASNPATELMWHGSRTENWVSILQSGLVLRPSNAVITGKMYGYGTYFSELFRKSLGYTSIRGSYWAKGNSTAGFLGLYEVHTGNRLVVDNWIPDQGTMTWDKLRKKGDYHSVHAPGGTAVRNPETIVYKENQTAISFLVEVR